MTIKQCTAADIEQLMQICRRTFSETFSSQNTAENMQRYLDETYSAQRLAEELSCADSFTYIAYEGEIAVGYIKLNRGSAQTEAGFDNSLEIQRIYLISDVKGRGFGRQLAEFAQSKARQLGLDYIWLGVWEHNLPAIGFYERLGFRRFSQHTFVLGEDKQTDILMRKSL